MTDLQLKTEFSEKTITIAQVIECLNNQDPRTGETWLEYCQKQGWGVEDMLRPLTVGSEYQTTQTQGRGRQQGRQQGRTP